MMKTLVLSLSLVLVFAFPAFSCFSPMDIFAAEAILNRPGIRYDLETMALADNVFLDGNAFVYRSHFDEDVAVILEGIDETQISEMLRGLSVRIQIPTKRVMVDGVEDLAEAVDISKDEFDFKSAMKVELTWLSDNEIIIGIDEGEIDSIAGAAEQGFAGWNSRLVCENGEWMPYSKTSNPMLIRDIDCSGFDLEKLPYDEAAILPGSSSVTSNGKLAARWGRIKAGL